MALLQAAIIDCCFSCPFHFRIEHMLMGACASLIAVHKKIIRSVVLDIEPKNLIF
jgi:hypothetical protein